MKRRRLELGLTQRETAARIGVNVFTLINWERGFWGPNLRAVPGVIGFLGYSPLAEGEGLGARLLAYRRQRGASQKELARELGVDPGTLRRWERGEREPRGRCLERVHTLLGCRA